MSRLAILFLVVITLGLALLLSFLGLATLKSNVLGWFLLITGLAYFFGVIIVYWIRGIRFWEPRAKGQIIKDEREDWSFWFIVAGMMAEFYLPPLEYLFFRVIQFCGIWLQVTGLALIFLGSVLFIWARRTLGKFYSGHVSVVEGQPLVQDGPYRFIRHPAYVGYALIALGITVGYASLAGLIAIPTLLIPAVLHRLAVEDALLANHFEEQFREYAEKTARLLPGVW